MAYGKTGSRWDAPNSTITESEQRVGDILKEELLGDWPVASYAPPHLAGRSPDMLVGVKMSTSVPTERKEDGVKKNGSLLKQGEILLH